MALYRTGGEQLFNLLTHRHELRATVVATNLAFAERVTVSAGHEKLTTALLDRFAHDATVHTTRGKSYRMWKRRTPRGALVAPARRPCSVGMFIRAVLGGRSPALAGSRCIAEHPEGGANRALIAAEPHRMNAPRVDHFPSGVLDQLPSCLPMAGSPLGRKLRSINR